MSKNITDRFLQTTEFNEARHKKSQKSRNQTLKQLKKNTKKKDLEEYLKRPKSDKKVQKLSPQQKTYHKSVLDELTELQDKCLGYMVMDKYGKKPDSKLIEFMKLKEEAARPSTGTVFTDADFEAFEKDYFKRDKRSLTEQEKDKKKSKQTEVY